VRIRVSFDFSRTPAYSALNLLYDEVGGVHMYIDEMEIRASKRGGEPPALSCHALTEMPPL